jgi:hypothetical protein
MNFNTKTVARILGLTPEIGYWIKRIDQSSVQEQRDTVASDYIQFTELPPVEVAKGLGCREKCTEMRKALHS